MVLSVTVYGLQRGQDVCVGRILLDQGRLFCEPPDSPALLSMLERPISLPDRLVTSADPVPFLNALQWQYQSAYRRATPPTLEG